MKAEEVTKILHPNSNKPNIKLLEMFEGKTKCAEIDITNMTGKEIWAVVKIQERLNRTWEYTTIKPYNWPSFDGKEVEK